MAGPQNLGVQRSKKRKTFYYRNIHGKVISLTEDVAAEQHNQHKEFLGGSDDLNRTGFNMMETIAKHLKENVPNPNPPKKKTLIGGNTKGKTKDDTAALKKEIEELKKIVKDKK